ncbi:uncharacterized protein BDW47DRAFT_113406 [Aspergillus candidus]|uniref:Uncharacterized protein n=1 Tax=Aspergillus candidus TaxID=41067 RepID=A0A2I2EZG6_ASPCN|nr:hypothetical protein BDW47DRAFT_113406 [Aspergillus candidus]PLB33771.1 hypothetical protein BDW47DRAFT_113406 [Aspergillus candidus]
MTQLWIRVLIHQLFLASSPIPFSILILHSLIDGQNDDEVLNQHSKLVSPMVPPLLTFVELLPKPSLGEDGALLKSSRFFLSGC